MEAPVIAAIIAAAVALVAVVANNWNKDLERRKLEAEVKKLVEVETTAVGGLVGRLGYKVRELFSETTFDENGDGESRRKWLDLESTKLITNLRFETAFRTSGAAEDPVVEALPGSALQVNFEEKSRSSELIEGWVVLKGNLMPTQKVSFFATHKFKKSFATTLADANQRYKGAECQTEYAVTDATVPAMTLKRQVVFPPSHRDMSPPPQAIVFAGAGETVDADETTRIGSGFSFSGTTALLVVNEPKPGRRYGISWMPPPARTPNS